MPAVLALVLLIESDPRPSEEVALEIVRACERVREPEPCRFVDGASTDDEWRAQVTAPSEHETRLELRGRTTGERIVRTLRFRPEDSPVERGKTIGLTLGVLAKSLEEKDETARTEPAPETATNPADPVATNGATPSATPPAAERAPEPERSVALGAALTATYDPSLRAMALGGRAEVMLPLASSFELGARVELLRTLGEPEALSLLEVRGLATFSFVPNRVPILPYLGIGPSYLDATIGDFPYRTGRLALYVEAGASWRFATSGALAFTLTPHVGFSPGTTRFSLGSEPLAETAPVSLGLAVGVRAEP